MDNTDSSVASWQAANSLLRNNMMERVKYISGCNDENDYNDGCCLLEEFQLNRRCQDKLTNVIDRCCVDDNKLFWISQDACFRKKKMTTVSSSSRTGNSDCCCNISLGQYYCISLILLLKKSNKHDNTNRRHHHHRRRRRRYSFDILGKTAADAVDCLDYLLSLSENEHDDSDDVDEVIITPKGTGCYQFNPTKCPITVQQLEKMLTCSTKNKRTYKFQRTVFSAEQAKILATAGTETRIAFRLCQFEDQGESFVNSFDKENDIDTATTTTASEQTQQSQQGPAHLTFDGYPTSPPFARVYWLRFLKSHQLQTVTLEFRFFCFDRECSHALLLANNAKGKKKGLIFTDCIFADEGEALVSSLKYNNKSNNNNNNNIIQQDQRQQELRPYHYGGLKELEIEVDTFLTLDRWKAFTKAIGHKDCHLEKLRIMDSSGNSSMSFLFATNNDDDEDDEFPTMTTTTTTLMGYYLSRALQTNQSLVEFAYEYCTTYGQTNNNNNHHHPSARSAVMDFSFASICDAVAVHPKLLSLDLKPNMVCRGDDGDDDNDNSSPQQIQQQKEYYSNLMATVVKRNQKLEYIPFHDDIYDTRIFFDTRIYPQLSVNRYRKLLHDYGSYHLKDVTLATALESVSSTPSLIWMLMRDHVVEML